MIHFSRVVAYIYFNLRFLFLSLSLFFHHCSTFDRSREKFCTSKYIKISRIFQKPLSVFWILNFSARRCSRILFYWTQQTDLVLNSFVAIIWAQKYYFTYSRIGAATHERLATDHRGTESKVYGAIDAAIGPSDPLLARKVKVIGGKAQSWESDRLEWKYGSDRIHQRCDSKWSWLADRYSRRSAANS